VLTPKQEDTPEKDREGAIAMMHEHDRICDRNPLVAELARATQDLGARDEEIAWLHNLLFGHRTAQETRSFIVQRDSVEEKRLLRLCDLLDTEARAALGKESAT
jgi:hypothetical protein